MIQQSNQQPNLQSQNLQEDSHQQQSCISEQQNKKSKQKTNSYIKFDNGFGNRKRREIKMEKEELTSIFSELIAFVNTRVDVIENEGQKIHPVSNTLLSFKSKKSIKQKKDEKQRQPIPLQFPDLPKTIRKSSLKEQKNTKMIQDHEKQKQELFCNYSQIMQYKIHQNEDELDVAKEKRVELAFQYSLGIFQSHSFSINPLYFHMAD